MLINNLEIDDFTRAYIECALWSSTDNGYLGEGHPDNDPSGENTGGNPLDDHFDIDDLPEETLRKMAKDCDDFRDYVEEAGLDFGELDDEQAGHDFWLTRNHHGSGFWDRGLGELGDKLSDAAHSFGDVYLYVGDDGKVYQG